MSAIPDTYPLWATNLVQESVVIDGVTLTVNNKEEPTVNFGNSGLLARENLPRPYLNWNFDLIAQWIRHLDERFAIGDFHLGDPAETASTIGVRLGGVWVDHGLDTIAAQSVRLFQKTA